MPVVRMKSDLFGNTIKKGNSQLVQGRSSEENVAIKHWNMTPSGACLTCLFRIRRPWSLIVVLCPPTIERHSLATDKQ